MPPLPPPSSPLSQGSGGQLPVDQSVLDKIKELVVDHGVIKLSEMRTHINLFVQQNYPSVSRDNRSYYPLNKDLLCHIYTTRRKAGIYHKKSGKPAGRPKKQRKYESRERHNNWENRSCSDYTQSTHWWFCSTVFYDIWWNCFLWNMCSDWKLNLDVARCFMVHRIIIWNLNTDWKSGVVWHYVRLDGVLTWNYMYIQYIELFLPIWVLWQDEITLPKHNIKYKGINLNAKLQWATRGTNCKEAFFYIFTFTFSVNYYDFTIYRI